MKKRMWILLFMMPLFFSGCAGGRNAEDREYVITMGGDYEAEDDQYIFSFAPAKVSEEKPKVFTAQGQTIAEAVVLADFRNSNKTDMGQMKLVILGDSLIKNADKLSGVLEEMAGSQKISDQVMMLATTGQAKACLEAVVEADTNTGLYLWDFYKNTAKDTAVIKGMDLETLLTMMAEQKNAVILPQIKLEEDGIHLGGGIGLTEGEYAYTLSWDDEDVYLMLLGEFPGILIKSADMAEAGSFLIVDGKTKYRFYENEDGKIEAYLWLKVEGDVVGGDKKSDGAEFDKQNLEKLFAGLIKDKIENRIVWTGEQDVGDVYGLQSRIRRKFPELAEESLNDVQYYVQVDIKIRDTGRIW